MHRYPRKLTTFRGYFDKVGKLSSSKYLCYIHSEESFSNSFQIERNTVLYVTVFILTMNQTEISLVYNHTENSQYDHIPFNLKSILIVVTVIILPIISQADFYLVRVIKKKNSHYDHNPLNRIGITKKLFS